MDKQQKFCNSNLIRLLFDRVSITLSSAVSEATNTSADFDSNSYSVSNFATSFVGDTKVALEQTIPNERITT